MALRLYNTLTRRVEELVPSEPGVVKVYCCGPTVYDVPHAGHARAALAPDLLVRRLRVSCRVVAGTRSTCNVRWRKSGASYRGRVFLRVRTVRQQRRWQYRIDVTKRRDGRAQRIRRSYRTGGIV